jgi:hypothetical protein
MLVKLMKRKIREKVHRIRHADSRASALYCTRPVSFSLYRRVLVYANVNLTIDDDFSLTRSSEPTGRFTLIHGDSRAERPRDTVIRFRSFEMPSLGVVKTDAFEMIGLFLKFPCRFSLAFANSTI